MAEFMCQGFDGRDWDRKVRALQDLAERGKLVKTTPVRDPNITRYYREDILARAERHWGATDPGRVQRLKERMLSMDADHIQELYLGGVDHRSSLWLLDHSVNRSIGTQVERQLRHVADGTKINHIKTNE